jgi:manganese oxidase
MRPTRPGAARTLLAILAAVTLALTGCGDDDPTVDQPPDQDAEGDEATADPGDEAPAGADVAARNIAFEPPTLTVTVGTTVTWTNEDVVAHTVTSGEPGASDGGFDERLDAEGEPVSVTFDEPGTFAYHCELHGNMTGEIVVE